MFKRNELGGLMKPFFMVQPCAVSQYTYVEVNLSVMCCGRGIGREALGVVVFFCFCRDRSLARTLMLAGDKVASRRLSLERVGLAWFRDMKLITRYIRLSTCTN